MIAKNVWNVKSTPENLQLVFKCVEEHFEDFNGRGELDEETGVMRCVEWVLENLLDEDLIKEE